MIGKLEAGSQNGAEDKREVGGAGGENSGQAEIQIVDSNRHASNRQVGQQVAVWTSNSLISAESSSKVVACRWSGLAEFVVSSTTQDVRCSLIHAGAHD